MLVGGPHCFTQVGIEGQHCRQRLVLGSETKYGFVGGEGAVTILERYVKLAVAAHRGRLAILARSAS